MLWTIDLLKKSLDDQILTKNLTSYKKGSVKNCYLNLFQLETTCFPLLYAEISVGINFVYTYFDGISQRIETISNKK